MTEARHKDGGGGCNSGRNNDTNMCNCDIDSGIDDCRHMSIITSSTNGIQRMQSWHCCKNRSSPFSSLWIQSSRYTPIYTRIDKSCHNDNIRYLLCSILQSAISIHILDKKRISETSHIPKLIHHGEGQDAKYFVPAKAANEMLEHWLHLALY